MEELIDKLQKLGFNKAEALVYYTLVKTPVLNGSQIAKILNMPRTSVYIALNSLYQKGVVFLLPGESNEYKAQSPDILFDKLQNEINNNIDSLKESFSKINSSNETDQFWNISGYENIINKIKDMINSAKNELYINTNINISIFKNEFESARIRSVRIILFSFETHTIDNLPVEYYHNDKMLIKESSYKRIMLVSDCKQSLIASGSDNDNYSGTFSDNCLLSSIISEHIHNDIYMYKLEKKYNKDLIENDIYINSMHEKMFKDKPKI
ncbi:MAG: hypothetical protein A2015_15240 [Spirochaetes bacterium GWF1_31_7]|nr:MAG: hypothetical protein A2Y30_11665 [Spirochaetes bacterium GWE1_32_154]OHD51175.1 MAG: hypothetical protein A2Y29_01205 [Spirochaetes bacterium GWE2_31_10]OHD52094.1 MAG: hypothetical protein A2015_15240 [Spirochaetes bacterium GWF1_31_7]OHD81037.1 MAG: hypothetical protein A2355_11205 [Spirochaetes bacterium RIFOXYB1_FULL_32_8]HBD93267.1 hypothetical protein [Spirochaetia bacterium]